MRLYHTTKHADAIKRAGFSNGRTLPEGFGLRARCGVWLADRPMTSADFADIGEDVLVLEIPLEVVEPFEQPDDPLGLPDDMPQYRAFHVPADVVNRYPIVATTPHLRAH
jgi:hypothetical protein